MVKRFNNYDSQLEDATSVVALTNEAKLSLYKKSQKSGISTDILEEVYHRGYNTWSDVFGGTPQQFAFDRVNSFIAGGFAVKLDEDLNEKRGLWDNIHAKRARIKAGSGEHMRKPGEKGAPTAAALKASQNESKEEELNKPVMTPEQLSKKHNKPVEVIKRSLKQGIKVEKEHTTHSADAKRIALAHLGEKPDYYTKLDKAGLEEEKKRQEAHSKNPNKSASRFDASDELVNIYKSSTPGQVAETVKRVVQEVAAWQRKEGKDPEGGLNAKGRASAKAQGMNLKPPAPHPKTEKDAGRRKSFCARMSGMKKRLTSAKTANDPDSRINKSLRKWNCEETEVAGFTGKKVKVKNVPVRMADGTIKRLPPGKSGSSGGGDEE